MNKDNIINITKWKENKESDINICTFEEFKNTMDGSGYDDSGFTLKIHPFIEEDGYVSGWWISFFNAEEGEFYCVAQDDHSGVNDFILLYLPLDELIKKINTLENCNRDACIFFEYDNESQ